MASRPSCLLSNLDSLMPPTYTRIFLTFPSTDLDAAVDALAAGLQRTCAQLPYLKGLVSPVENGRGILNITWSEDDPPVELKKIDAPKDFPTYAQLKSQGAPLHYFQNSLFPVGVMVDLSSPDKKSPALAASYTELDGGLLFSVCVHHHVMDGTGVGELLRLLAQNTAVTADSALSLPDSDEPLHRNERLRNATAASAGRRKVPALESLLEQHPEYNLPPPPGSDVPIAPVPRMPACTSKIFKFSTDKLGARRTALASSLSPEKLSINNILSAILWSCISRIRLLRIQQESWPSAAFRSKLGFAVNGRRRLGADFTEKPYLGNINLYGLTDLDMPTLVSASTFSTTPASSSSNTDRTPPTHPAAQLADVISAISTSISRITPTHISEVLSIVDQLPNLRALLPGWSFFNGPDLTLTSWAGLDVYTADFGPVVGGTPDFLRVPYAAYDGLVIILPRRRNKVGEDEKAAAGRGGAGGDIEVVVMLREDDMESLQKDEAWKSWLSE